MLKFLIRVALKYDFALVLRTAARLEYGAGVFCFKLAMRAQDEGYINLARYLKEQFAEEDAHAKMLGALIDGNSRLKRNCSSGYWQKGDYQAFDGISQRYWSAKLFFWFKKPEEFSWVDILAFMCVIEKFVILFYEVLSESEDESVVAIAFKIGNDEIEQFEKLHLFLNSFHPCPQAIVGMWRYMIFPAFLGLIIDILIAFKRNLIK